MFVKSIVRVVFAIILAIPVAASAVVITVSDYSTYAAPGSSTESTSATPMFRVTETYTSAAERGLTTGLYEYSLENLSTDLTVEVFSIESPYTDIYSDFASMSSPSGWTPRVGTIAFVWDSDPDLIGPGASLSGFQIETERVLESDLSTPISGGIYTFNTYSWILGRDSAGDRYDFFATTSVADGSVPISSTFLLMGIGLLGLGYSRGRKLS